MEGDKEREESTSIRTSEGILRGQDAIEMTKQDKMSMGRRLDSMTKHWMLGLLTWKDTLGDADAC